MERKGLVTSSEFARRLGITAPTLRRRIRRGELEVFRDPLDDRVRLLKVEDLEALLNPQPLGIRANRVATEKAAGAAA